MRTAKSSSVLAALASVLVVHCGSNSSAGAGPGCVTGDSKACVGPAGCTGGQVCTADGTYGPCDCGDASMARDAAPGDDAATMDSTSGDALADAPAMDVDAADAGTSVATIRQSQPQDGGTPVVVRGVVVTAHVTSQKYGHAWGQHQGGRP